MAVIEKMADARSVRADLTARLAEFAAATRYEDIPDEVIEGAKRSQLDTMGVALGGVAVDEAPRILGRFGKDLSASEDATVIGQGFKTSMSQAAHANGCAADVIGFSDVVTSTMNHPSASMCPALWALGEKLGSSGKAILAAHVIGVEIAGKIGHGLQPDFQKKGWEPRGLTNTFGAAAACSHLLGFDARQMANAFGICGAEASGMRAVKGTMSKSYINGMSARNGVEAALLTSRGFTGPRNVFEALDGVLQTFGDGASGEGIATNLGDPYEFVDPGLTYKAFPVCTCSHTTIEAVAKLKREHGFAPQDVESITCGTTPSVADWLPFTRPVNKFEAKYCMPFIVALTVVEGTVVVSAVNDEKVRDPIIVELMDKVTMKVLPEYAKHGYTPAHAPFGCLVTIRLTDGRVLSEQRDRSSWEPASPPSWEALVDKYKSCAGMVLEHDAVDRSIAIIAELGQANDIGRLMDVVHG